jgi:hypothetical protein
MYNLEQILELINKKEVPDDLIPENIHDIIIDLTLQVASPSYNRTPNFNSGYDDSKKRKNKRDYAHDHDKIFKKTEISKKTGIEKDINNLRSYINRISDKNYEQIYKEIINILDELNLKEDKDINLVCEAIYNIATSNRFYSELYAELYSALIEKFPILKTMSSNKMKTFIDLFNDIKYIDPEKDYDVFCKINAENEKRKSLGCFLLNLVKKDILDKKEYTEITCNLLKKLLNLIDDNNKVNEINEITENISLMYNKEIFIDCLEYFDGAQINDVFLHLAQSNNKYSGLSSKAKFKFMDIVGI